MPSCPSVSALSLTTYTSSLLSVVNNSLRFLKVFLSVDTFVSGIIGDNDASDNWESGACSDSLLHYIVITEVDDTEPASLKYVRWCHCHFSCTVSFAISRTCDFVVKIPFLATVN